MPIELSKNITKNLSRTNAKYALIADGDKVAVGLSGGKDSLTLVHALKDFQKKAPFHFDLKAITINYGMGENLDYLVNHCKKYDIDHEVINTKIFELAGEKIRDNSSFCSFFSRMRRGGLYTAATKMGYNKLALAHHLDDAMESFFMNMFYNGSLRTMPPIYKSDRDIWVIRPFIFLRERQFSAFAQNNGLETMSDDACPAMQFNVRMPHARAKMKEFVAKLEEEDPNRISSIKSAFFHIHENSFFDKARYDFEVPDYEKIVSSSKLEEMTIKES